MTTGGRTVAAALAAHGVELLWGIPGTHNLELYAGLRDVGIRHVSPRHEQGGAFAADGYARASGRVGVCVTTSGPAVLNAATALAQAYSDSIPVLLVAPGMPLAHPGLGNGELHETKDLGAAMGGIVAASHRVTSVEEIPVAVAQAFARMTHGRPRPMHLEIPLDLLVAEGEAHPVAPIAVPATAPDPVALDAAAALLARAERPLLLAGGGAVHAARGLRLVAERLGAPVVCSINGKGTLDEHHALSMGAGYGRAVAGELVADSDAVLVVGSELAPSDFWLGPPAFAGPVARIDVDPVGVFANAIPQVAVVGDAALGLDGLHARLGSGPRAGDPARARRWRDAFHAGAARDSERWTELLAAIDDSLGEHGVVAADSAMVCYYGALAALRSRRPRSFLYPTGFGTLGYALPAAIGAKLARPDDRVLALAGDGGVLFSVAELAAAAQERLALPVVVVDNSGYGEIRNEMRERGDAPLGVDFAGLDFAALGRAFNCHGATVTSPDEIRDVIEHAFAADRPTVIHVPE